MNVVFNRRKVRFLDVVFPRKLFQYPVRADNSFATPLQTVIRTVGNADILRLNIEVPEGG